MVRADHPRLWLTPAILTGLKAQAAAGSSRWLALKAVADRPAGWDTGIINYALAYQVTGDPNYAARAWSLMQQSMAAGISQITPDSGLQSHNYLPASAIVFDWLPDWLGPADRLALQADMETCADWVWPETNAARAHQWGVDNPGSNYYHSFMLTWMTGLALAGHSPKAQGYLDNARRRWDTEVVPYLDTMAQGGLMAEGNGYGWASVGWILWYLLAHLSATGEDLIAGNPWFTDAISAMIAMTNPLGKELAPFGDLSAGPVTDRHRRVMLGLAAKDPRCQAWLDGVTPNRNLQALTQWEEFLWYTPRPAVPAAESEFFSAPGTGIVSCRTRWEARAAQLLVKVGPTRESHEDRAIGSFYLFRDTWQAGTSKLTSHSGIAQDAWSHNCLSFDGKIQTWTQDTARLVTTEDTPDYTYLNGDLAGAYQGQVSAYMRQYFFVKNGAYLLIRDQYTPVNPASQAVWHLNTLVPGQPDGPLLSGETAFRAGALFGAVLSPGIALPAFVRVQSDPLDQVSYRVEVTLPVIAFRGLTPPALTAPREVIVALEAGEPAQLARTLQRGFQTPGLIGAVLGLAPTAALVAFLSGPGPWSYASPGSGPHFLLGVLPSTTYALPGGGVTTSSAGGVLSFAGPAVGHPVVIGGAGPPPPPLTLTSLSPNPAVSGQTVRLSGTGFAGGLQLWWGGQSLATLFLGPTSIAFVAPPVNVATVSLLKVQQDTQVATGLTLTVQPSAAPPLVLGYDTNPLLPGQSFSIQGAGFTPDAHASFDAFDLGAVYQSPKLLLATAGHLAPLPQTAPVVVTQGSGSASGPLLTIAAPPIPARVFAVTVTIPATGTPTATIVETPPAPAD